MNLLLIKQENLLGAHAFVFQKLESMSIRATFFVLITFTLLSSCNRREQEGVQAYCIDVSNIRQHYGKYRQFFENNGIVFSPGEIILQGADTDVVIAKLTAKNNREIEDILKHISANKQR